MTNRKYFTIKGKFHWSTINSAIGLGNNPPRKIDEGFEESPCGLSLGPVSYKVYEYWSKDMLSLVVAHVCIHSDGVCFSGALDLDKDWDYAEKLYQRVLNYVTFPSQEGG